MIITFNAAKPCFMCFGAIIEGFNNKLNSIINNIKRQIRVIFMELLRKFNVQLVNIHKKYSITYYNFNKAILDKFPGNFFEAISNFYGLLIGKLARG